MKDEVDPPIAFHEQILAITAFAHFSTVSDGICADFERYHDETVSWINVASCAIVKSLVSVGGGRSREILVSKLLQAHSTLLNDFLATFVRDMARTHVLPVLESYLVSESSEDALELLLLLSEGWSKTRRFVRLLFASSSPMDTLLSLHPSLRGLNLYHLKETLQQSLRQHVWEPLKSLTFDVVLRCDSQLSVNANLLHPLYSFFSLLKEPALAQFMPLATERSLRRPKSAILKTVDGFRFTVPLKHILRFDACTLDLERAERIGTYVDADDVLDEELELSDLVFSSDWMLLQEYSEFLDEIEAMEPQEQEEAKRSFTSKMLREKAPREIAAVILGARELGFRSLQESIVNAMGHATPTPSKEEHGE